MGRGDRPFGVSTRSGKITMVVDVVAHLPGTRVGPHRVHDSGDVEPENERISPTAEARQSELVVHRIEPHRVDSHANLPLLPVVAGAAGPDASLRDFPADPTQVLSWSYQLRLGN